MSDLLKVLYLGAPGSGKTTQGLLAMRAGKTVEMLSTDRAVERRPLRRLGLTLPDDWSEHRFKASSPLAKHVVNLYDRVEMGTGPDVAMLDTFSELNGLFLLEEGMASAKAGNNKPWQNEIQHFGAWVGYAKYLIRQLRDMPCHTVITAQEVRDTDDEGKLAYMTDLTPKADLALRAAPNTVVHMRHDTIGDRKFVYGIARTVSMYRGKDDLCIFPDDGLLVNPGVDKLLAILEGDLDPNGDAETLEYKALKKSSTNA